MKIGVPREIKNHEYRVGLTVNAVAELQKHGHQVFVETGAGNGVGMSDADFKAVGAQVLTEAAQVFEQAELIVKVKEPLSQECDMLRPGQTLFTFLHLAASRALTEHLLRSGACCIAYETITDNTGRLPVLTPMSQIAGRLSIQAGAAHLEKHKGGRGVLLGGATGTAPARVVVIGGGVVGSNACQIALGMGAQVVVLDRSINQLESLSQRFGRGLETAYASTANIEQHARDADLLIGAVLTAGRSADKIIPASLIKQMKAGAVMVDVAIDQGGCCENSRPTTHDDPAFVVDGVIHYCVSNMPGAVPVTASEALSNATLPWLLEMANQGVLPALRSNPHLRNGLNIINGKLSNQAVASGFGLQHIDAGLMLT